MCCCTRSWLFVSPAARGTFQSKESEGNRKTRRNKITLNKNAPSPKRICSFETSSSFDSFDFQHSSDGPRLHELDPRPVRIVEIQLPAIVAANLRRGPVIRIVGRRAAADDRQCFLHVRHDERDVMERAELPAIDPLARD